MASKQNPVPDTASDQESEDRRRVAEEYRARLRGRGIALHASDSLDQLGMIMDAVEMFEREVEAHGGDLMVDEPPPGSEAAPDVPGFALLRREDHESAEAYVSRLLEEARRSGGSRERH